MVEKTELVPDHDQIRLFLADFKMPGSDINIEASWATKTLNEDLKCKICFKVV